MNLFYLIAVFVIVGVALWAINKYIPMDPQVKRAMNIIVLGVLALWALKVLGVIAFLQGVTWG